MFRRVNNFIYSVYRKVYEWIYPPPPEPMKRCVCGRWLSKLYRCPCGRGWDWDAREPLTFTELCVKRNDKSTARQCLLPGMGLRGFPLQTVSEQPLHHPGGLTESLRRRHPRSLALPEQ